MKNTVLSQAERERIRAARITKGVSMQSLSKRLFRHRGAVEEIESGRRPPSPDFLREIYEALGLEPGVE